LVTIGPRSSRLCLTCFLHDLPNMLHLYQNPLVLRIDYERRAYSVVFLFSFHLAVCCPSVRSHGLCAVGTASCCLPQFNCRSASPPTLQPSMSVCQI
jgi:hypothetical protein